MRALTAKQIEHQPVPDKRREIPVDPQLNGFYLIVQPSGAKSWALRYRHQSVTKKLTLGIFPTMSLAAARAAAKEALDSLHDGIDPATSQADPSSAAAVLEEWLARDIRPRVRTWKEFDRVAKKEIKPMCKGKLITEITRPDILRQIDSIVDRGAPIQANEVLTKIKNWLTWCVERGYIETSPADPLRAPAKDHKRERVLSLDELRDVWNAADSMGYPNGRFVQLLILLAQRRGETAGMLWAEIDTHAEGGALWRLPAERTKPGRAHLVPLSSAAIKIIESLPRFSGPHVFTSGNGDQPINSFSKCKVALDKAVAKIRKERNADPIPPFNMHDLRRSATSRMAEAKLAAPHVLSAILNHAREEAHGISAVYNLYAYLPERREALESWGKTILELAKQKPSNAATVSAKQRAAS